MIPGIRMNSQGMMVKETELQEVVQLKVELLKAAIVRMEMKQMVPVMQGAMILA